LIITDTYNQLGEAKPGAVFDVLWTTDDPNTVNTVREYLKSTASPDAAHAGVFNNYVGKYRHVILPRVALTAAGAPDSTKSKYWGIASTAMSSLFFGEWEAPHMIPPTANGNAEDVQTDDWDFRNRAGYGITCVGAAWTKFSSGDSVA
jgi:hypothetical protein